MSALAPTLQAFFTDRLVQQHHASPHTIAAYRDAWRLLLRFAATHLAKAPSQLEISDLDAPLIGRFLAHLEHDHRFRRKPITDSDSNRSLIPAETDHRFRSKPITLGRG